MSSMGDEMPDGQGSFRAASGALARFTVLDLTRVRAGPTRVRKLGDWGYSLEDIARPRDDDAI